MILNSCNAISVIISDLIVNSGRGFVSGREEFSLWTARQALSLMLEPSGLPLAWNIVSHSAIVLSGQVRNIPLLGDSSSDVKKAGFVNNWTPSLHLY